MPLPPYTMTEACYVMMGQLESTLDASPVWHLQVSNDLFLHLNRFPERHGDRGYRDKICGPCSVPLDLLGEPVGPSLVACVIGATVGLRATTLRSHSLKASGRSATMIQ